MNQSELDEILERHSRWLRGENDGRRADLRRANLSGASLGGANLSGANLSEVNLTNAVGVVKLSKNELLYEYKGKLHLKDLNYCYRQIEIGEIEG